MSSPSGKEQYLKQLDQIVEGVKQNRIKVGNSDFTFHIELHFVI